MDEKYRELDSLRNHFKNAMEGIAASGSTGPKDLQVAAFMYFHHCLNHQHESISKILETVQISETERRKTIADLDAMNRISSDLNDIQKEMFLETMAIRHEEVQDIFAGTLFVLLNSLLRSMAKRLSLLGGAVHTGGAGRRIGNTTLYELILAASNNFRHFEEWNAVSPTNPNVAIMLAAGLHGPWDRNQCATILKLIGWTELDSLTLEIRKLASEILQSQTGIPL